MIKLETQTWREIMVKNNCGHHFGPPAKRPLHWEDYDWEMGLSDEEEAIVYETFPELLPTGDFDLKNLKKLRESGCNTVEIETPQKLRGPTTHEVKTEKPWSKVATKKEQQAMEEKPVYPKQFCKAKKRI